MKSLNDLSKLMTQTGIMLFIHPNTDNYKMPKKLDGAAVCETRDCEDRKVQIILKECKV